MLAGRGITGSTGMRWQMGRRSSNVEDRRGMSPVGRGVRAGGIGGLGVVAIALVAMFLGVDPSIILNGLLRTCGSEPSRRGRARPPARRPESAEFVSAVLAQTEDTWGDIFRQAGQQYRSRQLVLFAARWSRPAAWPARRPGRSTVRPIGRSISTLSFFEELDQRFGAPGDFAQAYVIAHEVGHHVQTLLGISSKVSRGAQRSRSRRTANQLSVMMELQADCFAGVWARHTHDRQEILEDGRHRGRR